MTFVIAQVFSISAMALNTVSYQCRKRGHILLMQLIANALFTVAYALLNAPMGALLNVLGVLRGTLYGDSLRKKINVRLLNGFFIVAFGLAYAASFLLLGKEPTPGNLVLELLPAVAMVISTLGFGKGDAKSVRTYSAASTPLWLVYNVASKSIGGTLSDLFVLCSSLTAYWRLDKKKSA